MAARRPADQVLREFFRTRRYLGSSDRRFIAEKVFAVLRHHTYLSSLAAVVMARMPDARMRVPYPSIVLVALLEAGKNAVGGSEPGLAEDVGGIWRMDVPDADCASFLGIARGVRLPDSLLRDDEEGLAVRYSLPAFVVRRWLDRYGAEETKQLCEAMNAPAPVSVRVNTLACTVEQCRASLAAHGIDAATTRYSPVGLVLPKRVNVQELPPFRQGWFEMQDEGSQILSYLPEVRPGMTIVDACAGGGGKTLHLAALMGNRGRIIAVDISRFRLESLKERARRGGVTITETVIAHENGLPPLLRDVKGDVVTVDAPCSGTGTFRRSPWLKLNLEEERVREMSALQLDLLRRYAPVVAPGGKLFYSTCSLLCEENEEVVRDFLRDSPEFSLLQAGEILRRQGLTVGQTEGADLTLLPHKTGTDGFYGAVMVRSA